MAIMSLTAACETATVRPFSISNIHAPVDTNAATTKAPAGEDQVKATRSKHVKESRQSRRARRSRQNCQECQSSATENITICAMCEYVAIYGQKPYAPLLHRPIKELGNEISRRVGVPRTQLKREMPRSALEYLLTGRRGKNSICPMDLVQDSPTTASSTQSSMMGGLDEVPINASIALDGLEETRSSLLEKLRHAIQGALPPELLDKVVDDGVLKWVRGGQETAMTDSSIPGQAQASEGSPPSARRKGKLAP